MSLDVSHLRSISATQGFLRPSTNDAAKPAVFGNGLMGKIAAWIRDPGQTANKALKEQFLSTLSSTYGPEFRAANEARVNGDAKPLSVRTVKDILAKGDILLEAKNEVARTEAQAQARITAQNASVTKGLAHAFSSPEHKGLGESPMRTALRGPASDCGFTAKLTELSQASRLNADAKIGAFEYRLEHVKLPTELQEKIKADIIAAGQNGAKAVGIGEAAAITKAAIKDSGLLERKLDYFKALDGMANLSPVQKAAAIDAIVRNDFPSFEAFKTSYFQAAPSRELTTALYGGDKAVAKDHTNASLTGLATDLRTKSYDASTYDPAAFFGKVKDAGVAKDWSLNRAIQAHFAQGLPEGSAARSTLDQRGLVYQAKFAANSSDHQLGMGSAAWQNVLSRGIYHRGGTAPIALQLTQNLARTIGVPAENLNLVTDGRVMEAVKRDFAMSEGSTLLSWKEQDLDALCARALAPMKPGKIDPILLDVSEFTAATTQAHAHNPEDLKMAIEVANSFIHDAIVAHVDDYCARHAGDTPPPNAKDLEVRLKMRVVLASTLQIGDQTALYTRELGARDAKGVYREGRMSPTEENSIGARFREVVYHNGFAPGPNQIIENWIKTAPNTETVAAELVRMTQGTAVDPTKVTFPTDATGLATFRTMRDFESTTFYQAFEAMARNADGSSAPYQAVLGANTLGLLKGLATADVHGAFAREGLGDHLQISLNRIQAAMQSATEPGASFRTFQAQVGLIHEEVATLLAVAKPIRADTFSAEMNRVSPLLPKGFLPEVSADFRVTNSGMRSLTSALTGLEALKTSLGGGSALNIAVQADCYYESSLYVLNEKNENRSFTIDGRALDTSVGGIADSLAPTGSTPKKLDLYVAEFHHNISYGLETYVAEPVKDQVDKLFAKGLASDKFTVALDVTLSRTDAPEIQDFLAHNKQRIEDGQLNVVFYRSAQKFDMAGMDNFNGGIMATVNNGTKGGWDAFNQAARGQTTDAADRVSDYNLQGIGAYQLYAQKELNEYRSGIVAATEKLNTPQSSTNPLGMPKEMFATPQDRGKMFLQLAVNQDPGAVFLDFRAPWMTSEAHDTKQFYKSLAGFFADHLAGKYPDKFQIEARPSFGFPHSNVSVIGGAKFRFNPGLESDATLKNYRDAFLTLNSLMGMAMADYRDPVTANKIASALIETDAGRKIFDMLSTQPDMTKLDAKTRTELGVAFSQIGNYKAAARAMEGIPLPDANGMSASDRISLGLAFAKSGNMAATREMIGRLPTDGLSPTEDRRLNDAHAAINSPKGDVGAQTTAMTTTMEDLRAAMQDGSADRIRIMSALGQVHDTAVTLGLDPERTMREMLSADLKTRSPSQLANIEAVLTKALDGLDDRSDPVQNAMRSTLTFAQQDQALVARFVQDVRTMIDLRPRDPSDTSKKHGQHALGDFASSVQYYATPIADRKPLTGGDRIIGTASPGLHKLATTVAGPGLDAANILAIANDETIKEAADRYVARLPSDAKGTRQFNGLSDMMLILENGVRRQLYMQFDGMVKNTRDGDEPGVAREAAGFEKSVNESAINLTVVGRMFTDAAFLNRVPAEKRETVAACGRHYLAVANELADRSGAAQTLVEFARMVRTNPSAYQAALS